MRVREFLKDIPRNLHVNRSRHIVLMAEAGKLIDKGYEMRDKGDYRGGWDMVSLGASKVARCGCPRDWWPDAIQWKISDV